MVEDAAKPVSFNIAGSDGFVPMVAAVSKLLSPGLHVVAQPCNETLLIEKSRGKI